MLASASARRDSYDGGAAVWCNRKPIVAAIHGAAIGGGLGWHWWPIFRVTCPQAPLQRQLHQLGINGFGLTTRCRR